MSKNATYYYYFYTVFNREKMKKTLVDINTTINKNYTEMTAEQAAFWEEHPDATVTEVRNCELAPVPPVPPPTPIEEIKDAAMVQVNEAAMKAVGRHVSDFKLAMAMVGAYSLTENARIKKLFENVGGDVETKLNSVSSQMASCETEEDVSTLKDNSVQWFNNYTR